MANEEAFHLVLAAFIGVIGGLVNLVFFFLVNLIQWVIFRETDNPAVLAQGLSAFERIIIPTLGGLLAGFVLLLKTHLSGSKKVTNVLEAVAVGDGRLGMRATLIHAWSSLLSIGTGASIGREGAITQLTATFASKWGQFQRWQPKLWLFCILQRLNNNPWQYEQYHPFSFRDHDFSSLSLAFPVATHRLAL